MPHKHALLSLKLSVNKINAISLTCWQREEVLVEQLRVEVGWSGQDQKGLLRFRNFQGYQGPSRELPEGG